MCVTCSRAPCPALAASFAAAAPRFQRERTPQNSARGGFLSGERGERFKWRNTQTVGAARRTDDGPQVGAAVVRKHLLRACVLITCKPEKRRQGSAWRHNRGEGELCVHVPLPSRSKANSLPCAVVFRLDMIHACTAEERPSARSCCSTSPLLLHGLRARRPSAARPAQRAQRELTF